jgi:hypothetical protein
MELTQALHTHEMAQAAAARAGAGRGAAYSPSSPTPPVDALLHQGHVNSPPSATGMNAATNQPYPPPPDDADAPDCSSSRPLTQDPAFSLLGAGGPPDSMLSGRGHAGPSDNPFAVTGGPGKTQAQAKAAADLIDFGETSAAALPLPTSAHPADCPLMPAPADVAQHDTNATIEVATSEAQDLLGGPVAMPAASATRAPFASAGAADSLGRESADVDVLSAGVMDLAVRPVLESIPEP